MQLEKLQAGVWPFMDVMLLIDSCHKPMSLSVSGPGEESPDVRCAWGGGGPEGADQGADWAQLPAGAGEHPAEDTGQPGTDGPVPGPSSDWLPACPSDSCHTGTPKHCSPRPACLAQLWPLSVAWSAHDRQTDWLTDSFWALLQQQSQTLPSSAGGCAVKTRFCTYLSLRRMQPAGQAVLCSPAQQRVTILRCCLGKGGCFRGGWIIEHLPNNPWTYQLECLTKRNKTAYQWWHCT